MRSYKSLHKCIKFFSNHFVLIFYRTQLPVTDQRYAISTTVKSDFQQKHLKASGLDLKSVSYLMNLLHVPSNSENLWIKCLELENEALKMMNELNFKIVVIENECFIFFLITRFCHPQDESFLNVKKAS